MILTIDTSHGDKIELGLNNEEKNQKTIETKFNHSEILLPSIRGLLSEVGLGLSDLTGISVYSQGDSFTSLRLGVVAANALAFALGIPVEAVDSKDNKICHDYINLVKPEYSKNPNITISKK